MHLTEHLLRVALFGAEWVLWILIALSVLSVALVIERIVYYRTTFVDADTFGRELRALLDKRDVERARALARRHEGAIEADVIAAGLSRIEGGHSAANEAMAGARTRGRLRLQRNLSFLGTLGNNAPFVGLFGTVLGIIQAFHDLASKKGQGPEAVMGSLSEALIATGVGLLVAIPAVIAFNWFQGIVKTRLGNADGLAHDLLADVEPRAARAGAR